MTRQVYPRVELVGAEISRVKVTRVWWVGDDRVRRCWRFTGEVWSGQQVFKYHWSSRVGSGGS